MKKYISLILIVFSIVLAYQVSANDSLLIKQIREKILSLQNQIKNKKLGSAGGTVPSNPINAVVPLGTSGSLLFVGSTGLLAQDNSNLFWDSTNLRLGIATGTPGTSLSIGSVANFSSATTTIYSPVSITSSGTSSVTTSLGIGTTSSWSMLSAATTTATTTLSLGAANSSFGSCIQMYSATGTPYRLYISGERSANPDPASTFGLRVETGGCSDIKPRP